MFKKLSWKTLISHAKLISVSVVLLMVIQVLTVFFVSTTRKTERFNGEASESLLASVVSMDEIFNYMTEVSVSTMSSQKINYILFSDSVTKEDVYEFRNAARSIQQERFMKVKDVFAYNDQTQMVYSCGLYMEPIDTLPDTATKSAILSQRDKGDSIAYFVDNTDFLSSGGLAKTDLVLRFRSFPSRQSNSCLILDVALTEIAACFSDYCDEYSSDIIVMDDKHSTYYSTNAELESLLYNDMEQLSEENFRSPVFRRYDGKKYLVIKHHSGFGDLSVYSLIPESAVKVDYRETKIILLTNLSLVVAVCVIFALFIVMHLMNDAVKENSRHQLLAEQEKEHNQFIKNKQYLANCLFRPGEQDIRFAKAYMDALHPESSAGVAVLRFEICNYEKFHDSHSSKDVLLYKYGIVNICEEILNNHIKALSVYERDADIVFVVIPSENYEACCQVAYDECRQAVFDYIGESLSAYLSKQGPVEELSVLNQQTIDLAAYKFLLYEPLYLESKFLEQKKRYGTKDMMESLEQVFNVPERTTVVSELEKLFVQLEEFHLDDAKNALWILMFRLYNTGKKAAKQMESMETLVSRFNRIPNLSSMKTFLEELCAVVYPDSEEEDASKKNELVQKVLSIIERRFKEPGFCSDHVAEEMRLSKAYLSRKFRQSADTSIQEAINERRLEEFARYLVSTDGSIKSIIDEIGGTNPNYYMIMFKKKFQMTPTEYRQAFKNTSEGE